MGQFSEPVLIDLPAAAIRLKMSHRRAYDLALSGGLGDVERIGTRIYVPLLGVQAAEAQRAAERTTPPAAA